MKRTNGESHAGGPGEKRSNDGATVPPPLYQPSQKFRLELIIDNLNELAGDGDDATYDVEGPDVTVGNSDWSLNAQVKTKNGSDFLDIYVSCQSPGAGWRLMMDYTARVVGSDVQKVQRGVKARESGDDVFVFSEKKQELLDAANDYVTEGTFKMEVDVTIYEPYRMLVDFFTADSNYDADVVLRVQDRRFHANKAYLGHESDYFRQLFFGPLADNSHEEVPLGGVDADEFLQFLGAIHRMRAPITDDNVEILVNLADRFQVLWLVGDCEDFLMKSEDFTTVQKLIMCTKVKLDQLQKECLDELTLEDVDTLVDLDRERMAGTKLDGCLLQELLGKQKELMKAKVAWLLGDCEDFLLSTYRFTVVQKLIISTKFNLDELQQRCLLEMKLHHVDTLLCMDEESAMGVKLDGRLLQGLLGKLKQLMESKHKIAVGALEDEHEAEKSSLKAKACTRCQKYNFYVPPVDGTFGATFPGKRFQVESANAVLLRIRPVAKLLA